jgi:hypothetical protein
MKYSALIGLPLLFCYLLVSFAHAKQFEVKSQQEGVTHIQVSGTQPLLIAAAGSDHGVESRTIQYKREDKKSIPELKDHRGSGPYCGINSLYACLSALDIDIEPAELISVDYVGSQEGSSVDELVRAAEHAGARATCISHMSWRDLQQAIIGSPFWACTRTARVFPIFRIRYSYIP